MAKYDSMNHEQPNPPTPVKIAKTRFWGAGKRKLGMEQILEDLRDESD